MHVWFPKDFTACINHSLQLPFTSDIQVSVLRDYVKRQDPFQQNLVLDFKNTNTKVIKLPVKL